MVDSTNSAMVYSPSYSRILELKLREKALRMAIETQSMFLRELALEFDPLMAEEGIIRMAKKFYEFMAPEKD